MAHFPLVKGFEPFFTLPNCRRWDYTGSSDFVNTICVIFENFMKFFLKTFHNRRR